MIKLNDLAQKLMEKLGKSTEYNFYLTTDTGKLKRDIRVGNEVYELVNGILSAGVSEVTNLVSGQDNALKYATQTATLRFIFALTNSENDNYLLSNGDSVSELPETLPEGVEVVQVIYGNRTKISNLRTYLNSIFQGVEVEDMTDSDGKTFSVTTVYSLAESGTRDQLPVLGNSFSFYLNIYYSFVENGINTRDMVFYLDGVPIPYQAVTPERNSIIDANVYANSKNGTADNIALQSTLTISFQLPAVTNNAVTDMILEYILDGPINKAHLLRFSIGSKTQTYLVQIGGGRLSGDTIKNVGQGITFLPCVKRYALLTFGENIKVYSATDSNYSFVSSDEKAVIFVFGKGFYNGGINHEISGAVGDKIISTSDLTITNLEQL